MRTRSFLLFSLWIACCLLAACSSSLRVTEAYHRTVRYGQPNTPPGDDYVLSFTKSPKSVVNIDKVVVLGKYGNLLTFSQPQPVDPTLSKSFSSTEGLDRFAILMRDKPVVERLKPGEPTPPAVQVYYSVQGRSKRLTVKALTEGKEIRLR